MLKFIKERINDYDANYFINDLALASKKLGILEAKIESYQFNNIVIPMLQKQEAISSMHIEGTRTNINDVYTNEVSIKTGGNKEIIEVENCIRTLIYGAEHLKTEKFTNNFLRTIHEQMMIGVILDKETLGKYKTSNNFIINSAGSVVFVPPGPRETKKYMNELIDFMNNTTDGINPLIKAAIIHSQFESIHPFSDGNGRVGRLLVSLYLYKANVINFPFFYISEAISIDKTIYYRMLSHSRENSLDEWIKFFLSKIIVQTERNTKYFDSINKLYIKTKDTIKQSINTTKFDEIIECIFTHPIINANCLENKLSVSRGQAVRYLNILEEKNVLDGDDRQRGRTFYFSELLDIARS